jgi:signal transduction histidine kinase
MTMKSTQSIDVLQAAVHAMVTERYRQSYIHDIHGELQSLYGGVELLTRAANGHATNAPLADKATALVKRALVNHEKMLVDLVNRIAPRSESPSPVNIGELTADVLRFVRGDFASKSVTFRLESSRDVVVLAQADRLRTLILGLSATAADELAPGSVVDVSVARTATRAVLEFRSMKSYAASAVHSAGTWHVDGTESCPEELVLALTRQWVSAAGGHVELTEAGLPSTLRIYYPLAASGAGTL